MIVSQISKLEAARRQLETAIKLFFDNGDGLSIHTLAYASFRILFDIYPLHNTDGLSIRIDELIQEIGWRRFACTANFLKHADRDPNNLLEDHDAESSENLIGLAATMYRRLSGDFTPLMRGFDCWIETLHPEAFNIPPDPDPERELFEKKAREAIKAAPPAERLMNGQNADQDIDRTMGAQGTVQPLGLGRNALPESLTSVWTLRSCSSC